MNVSNPASHLTSTPPLPHHPFPHLKTCTSTFFKHFHVMCIPTCVDHLTSSSDPDLPPYTFPMPRVAKCTGLGGGVFFQACEAGFFDVISQVLVGLGVKEGESLEVVRERKRLEREVRRREIEEVRRGWV